MAVTPASRGTSVSQTASAPAPAPADDAEIETDDAAAADEAPGEAQAGTDETAPTAQAAASPTANAPAAGYPVVRGDSLWKIATRLHGSAGYPGLGVSQIVEALKADNPQVTAQGAKGPKRKSDGGLIYPDEVLKIRQGTQAPPAGAAAGGSATPSQGWVNSGTPARNPNAAAAAAKPPATAAEFLDAKYPTYLKALTADPVSPANVEFIRKNLARLKDDAPELNKTFQFQDLLNKADAADAKSKAISDNAKTVVVPAMLAKLKAGGVQPAEANAMVDQLKKIAVSVSEADQNAIFGELVQKLAQAGATNLSAAQGPADGGAAPAAAAAAPSSGTPAGRAVDPNVVLQALLNTNKINKAAQDKINQAFLLTKQPGKANEAKALFDEAMNDPTVQAFVKSYGTGQQR